MIQATSVTTSAGEVFTTEVPKKALTGRLLLLSQNTSVGRRILGDVVPKNREYAANGTFAEWNKAFEGIFATVDEAEGVLEDEHSRVYQKRESRGDASGVDCAGCDVACSIVVLE